MPNDHEDHGQGSERRKADRRLGNDPNYKGPERRKEERRKADRRKDPRE